MVNPSLGRLKPALLLAPFVALLIGQGDCGTPTETLAILPLGDSITHGFNVPGGYRIDLEDQLAARGFAADFLGSMVNGPPSLEDKEHEGHPGWRIDEISAWIGPWLDAYQPQTVLLLIGTNDVLQTYALDQAPDRLGLLMDQIIAQAPGAHLMVASITPLSNPASDALVVEFNAAIPGLVQARQQAGAAVSFVDMYPALTAADLADGIHPNRAGYDKMADVWTAAILANTVL